MKVLLCKKCYGKGKIINRDEFNPTLDYDVVPYKDCPECKNMGIITYNQNESLVFLNSVLSISGVRYSDGIFGSFTTHIRLKKKNNGFDLWVDKKKLTRGNKYLIADSISKGIAETLKGNEYRKDLYFEFYV